MGQNIIKGARGLRGGLEVVGEDHCDLLELLVVFGGGNEEGWVEYVVNECLNAFHGVFGDEPVEGVLEVVKEGLGQFSDSDGGVFVERASMVRVANARADTTKGEDERVEAFLGDLLVFVQNENFDSDFEDLLFGVLRFFLAFLLLYNFAK